MPVTIGLARNVNQGYAGYSPGGVAPPDVEHIQNGDFSSSTGHTLSGAGLTIAAGVLTKIISVAPRFDTNALTTPLVNGGSYVMQLRLLSFGTEDTITLYAGSGTQSVGVIQTTDPPDVYEFPFVANAAHATARLAFEADTTAVVDEWSLIGP